ncbi:MAG: NAD(P)H-dependent oxidoreductase [Lachnospiraceae bacterium]|nr:NAD(P)H-dependent oxidoreductase [Lachnospiraceae bacterium]
MKIVIVNGQNHVGSTCRIARDLARKVGGEVTEFFLPRDFDEPCVGCTGCFMKDRHKCPHFDKLEPITQAIDAADLIILASPVYVFHATAQMMALLDHYGYRWIIHRPEPQMFHKQAVCISTAAGGGMRSTNRDMSDSLFFWGIAKIYKLGYAIRAVNYDSITEKRRAKIERDTASLAARINRAYGHVKPGLRTKLWFYMVRFFHKQNRIGADWDYWEKMGWHAKKRPWQGG